MRARTGTLCVTILVPYALRFGPNWYPMRYGSGRIGTLCVTVRPSLYVSGFTLAHNPGFEGGRKSLDVPAPTCYGGHHENRAHHPRHAGRRRHRRVDSDRGPPGQVALEP